MGTLGALMVALVAGVPIALAFYGAWLLFAPWEPGDWGPPPQLDTPRGTSDDDPDGAHRAEPR